MKEKSNSFQKLFNLPRAVKILISIGCFGLSLAAYFLAYQPVNQCTSHYLFAILPVISITIFWGFPAGAAAVAGLFCVDLFALPSLFEQQRILSLKQVLIAALIVSIVYILTGYFRKLLLLYIHKEKMLIDSEMEYRTIVSYAKSVIVKYDMDGKIIFFNTYAEDLFGYSQAEVVGLKGIETINKPKTDEEKSRTEHLLQELLIHTGEYEYNENYNYCKDGTELWMAWTNAPLFDNEGKKTAIICIGNNKTQQKEAEKIILRNLEEKSVLLKEIHHRVKNNLQVVASILNLQVPYLQHENDKYIFENCENRINSMALIHEQLYQTENFTYVIMEQYIESLIHALFNSYIDSGSRIRIILDIDDIHLNIDKAIPCGLIVTELFSNSIKHAFPGQSEGLITLTIRESGETILISLADDGIGFREVKTWHTKNTLGLQLVNALSSQLGAEITVSSEKGTQWNITIPV